MNTQPFDVLHFNNAEIQIYGDPQTPYFIADDICKSIGLADTFSSVKRLNEKDKKQKAINRGGSFARMLIITENGIYKLLYSSNKPLAEKLVCLIREKLDSIRRQRKQSELKYKNYKLRYTGPPDQPLFVVHDIGKILGLSPGAHAVAKNNVEDENIFKKEITTPGGVQEMIVVNRNGLEQLLTNNRSSVTFEFRLWLKNKFEDSSLNINLVDILPEFRKTIREELYRQKLEDLIYVNKISIEKLRRIDKVKNHLEPEELSCLLGTEINPKIIKMWSETSHLFEEVSL